MNFFTELFNNREKAVIIWLFIFIVVLLFQKNIRMSLFNLLKAFFLIKIITLMLAMILYMMIFVFIFYKIGFWNITLIKDTVFWLTGTASILLMNVNKANKDQKYFRKILVDNLKFVLVLEFIVNLYAFSLWIELTLMPLFVFGGALIAMADVNRKYMQVKKPIEFIMGIYGIFIIVFTSYRILTDFQNFATIDNVRAFLVPPLLTVAYIPALYFFALYMAYEILFTRVDIFLKKDKALAKFAKRQIIALCHVNLKKLNKFAKESAQELMRLNDKEHILLIVQQFNNTRD